MNRLLLAALLGAFTSILNAADWPQFRGPTGQGHSPATNLPITWSATANVAWKQPLSGEGWSSPVIVGERVFLTAAVRNAGNGRLSLRALCLDAGLGRILWNIEVFSPDSSHTPGIHSKNSHASPTPLVEDGRVYVHFGHQGTACLDLDGRIIWRNAELYYAPLHGNGGSPILVGDRLFFSCDAAKDPFIAALHKDTGKLAWKRPRLTDSRRTFSFSTPLLVTTGGRQQIISPGSGVVCAYAPADGRELWRVRYGDGYSVIPRPVSGHGLVFVATGYDHPTVMAIRPDGAGDVTDSHVAWTIRRGAPNTPSLLLVGNELYMVSDAGIATCLDARTGKVHWEERLGGNFSASPVFADGRLYFQSERGVGTVLKPGREFLRLADNPLGERTLASVGVTDGALFIRTAENLYKIANPAR